jgi:hypothetical protein
VKKVATLAGKPLVVDELSLIKTNPIRVKINCRDPYKLRGFVRIFFNLVGYNIRFVSEKFKESPTLPPSPTHRKNRDEDYDDNMDEDSKGDSDRGHKRSSLKGKGQMHIAKKSNKSGSHTMQQDVGLPMDCLKGDILEQRLSSVLRQCLMWWNRILVWSSV